MSPAPVRGVLSAGIVKSVVDLVVRLEVAKLAGQHVDVHMWDGLPCSRAVLQRSAGSTQEHTICSRAIGSSSLTKQMPTRSTLAAPVRSESGRPLGDEFPVRCLHAAQVPCMAAEQALLLLLWHPQYAQAVSDGMCAGGEPHQMSATSSLDRLPKRGSVRRDATSTWPANAAARIKLQITAPLPASSNVLTGACR